METKQYKKNYIFGLISISFFIIIINFHRYYKNKTGFEFTDWLINYQGGFVRRGLIGELLFSFSKLTNLEVGLLVFVFVSLLYFLFYFCFFKLIKNIKINWLLTLAIFSPFSFYYPVMISKVTGRKEILYLAAISILSVLVSKIKFEHIKYILILISIILLLNHSAALFFYPYIFILFFLNHINKGARSILFELTPVFVVLSILVFLVLKFGGSQEHVNAICDSLKDSAHPSCKYGGQLEYLKEGLAFAVGEKGRMGVLIPYLKLYLPSMIVGFFPLFLLFNSTKFENKYLINLNPILIFILPFILSLPIYYIVVDWGRYLYVSYISSLIIFCYAIENNIIIYKKDYSNYSNLSKLKKFLLILSVFFYGFFWTVPHCCDANIKIIYKKPIKEMFKIINNT